MKPLRLGRSQAKNTSRRMHLQLAQMVNAWSPQMVEHLISSEAGKFRPFGRLKLGEFNVNLYLHA